MELLIKNAPTSYETDDVVVIMPDGNNWGTEEIKPEKFSVIKNVILTDGEKKKLAMVDEQPRAMASVAQLPTFRSLATSFKNLKSLHRRKYYYNNGVVLKDNAQVNNGG